MGDNRHPEITLRRSAVRSRVAPLLNSATWLKISPIGGEGLPGDEMLHALNHAEKFHLAIMLVGDDDTVEGPFYLQNPFDGEAPWGAAAVSFPA